MKHLILILILLLSTPCFAESMECKEHGNCNVVEITMWQQTFYLCEECVIEFIANNYENFNRFIEVVKEERLPDVIYKSDS